MKKVLGVLFVVTGFAIGTPLIVNYVSFSTATERAEQGIVPLLVSVALVLILFGVRLVSGPVGDIFSGTRDGR